MLEVNDKAMAWIVGPDVGQSSKTIWCVMMHQPEPAYGGCYPLDPSDFGRCYRLLLIMPEWEARIDEVGEAYPEWKPLIREWSQLKRMWQVGIATSAKTLPEMYGLMKDLIAESRE